MVEQYKGLRLIRVDSLCQAQHSRKDVVAHRCGWRGSEAWIQARLLALLRTRE